METLTLKTLQSRLAFLALLSIVISMTSGAQASMSSQTAEFKKNVAAIASYDIDAIKKAGRSNNRAYIPYLRDILVHTDAYRSPEEEEAVVSLAKLGDAEELTRLECKLLTNDPATVHHLAGDVLPKIKGWFAIREYFFMLTQDAQYAQELKRPEYNTDAVFGVVYPSHWAVRYLPIIVPHAPFAKITSFQDPRIPRLARQWKIWIQQNRAQLEELQPQGSKGLHFSTTGCTKNNSDFKIVAPASGSQR